jgi:multidrug resistance efflux pump
MKQDNLENTEYFSGEVQEILAKPPSWVATWGTSVFISVIVLLGLVGVFFEYPETVKGTLLLTTIEPPVPVHAQKTAYLTEVKARENAIVERDEVLAVFANNADYRDVLKLERDLESLSEFDLNSLRSFQPDLSLQIGELAPAYSSFVNTFEYLPLFETGQIDRTAIYALERYNQQMEKSINSLRDMKSSANKELYALEREREFARKQYAETVDTSKAHNVFKTFKEVSEKTAEIKNIDVNIERYKDEIANNNARMLEMQLQQKEGAKEKIYQLKQSLSSLKTEIKRWKENYLVTAPVSGRVLFYAEITPGQILTTGEEVFAVVPASADNQYVGKVKIPVDRSGKVRPKQEVVIKFDRYPFREFGVVKGKVAKIYPVAKGDYYSADVTLDNGLNTSLGKQLDFQQQMGGRAEIITDKELFIVRLFDKFLSNFE